MEQQLETLRDMKYEVYKMMIDNNVEYEIVGECVNMTMKKMERYQELIDRLKGCLEDLLEKKKAEIRQKEDQMQQQRFKRRMEKQLKIEEMKLEMKQKNEDKDMIANRKIRVKLPMVVIARFEDTNLDWFRF